MQTMVTLPPLPDTICLAWKPECTETYCKHIPSTPEEGCAVTMRGDQFITLANLGGGQMCAMVASRIGGPPEEDVLYGASAAAPLCTAEFMRRFRDHVAPCAESPEMFLCPYPLEMFEPCPSGEVLIQDDDGGLRCARPAQQEIIVFSSPPGTDGL
jgi:hypothetical protein